MFKEYNNILTQSEQQLSVNNNSPELNNLIKKLKDKPFWIFGKTEHDEKMNKTEHPFHPHEKGQCCFNHIIGLPKKGGSDKEYPLFDYERLILQALELPEYLNKRPLTPEDEQRYEQSLLDAERKRHEKGYNTSLVLESLRQNRIKTFIYPQKVKHVAVLKASGLGITELILRWIVYKALRGDLQNSQAIIFTGPRIELATSLISRARSLLTNYDPNIKFEEKETVINLNGCRIEAYPSHHASTARGLPNVSIVFVDEASFIPDHETTEIMDIMLRYVPKSDPYLIAVSTPNKPGDFMDILLKEKVETSPFKKMLLDWRYGIVRYILKKI